MGAEMDLVIRGGQVVTPGDVLVADIGIKGGRIAQIGAIGPARDEIDARGRMVLPGGVDTHAHIEQMSGMGLWNADTFESATRSAALGGTTSVISFAAQAKGQRLSQTVADYSARAARGAMIDHAFHLILSDTKVPDFDAELGALIEAGHRSLKVFTTYNIQITDAEILHVMALARQHGALVCVHAENDAIIARAKAALIAAGQTAPRDHARARPRIAEIEAVQRICHYAEWLRTPVMVFHISTLEGAEAIRAAKARGAPVWAETCPHYLFLTEEVLDKPGIEGAKWMCSPPQRGAADQAALWAALETGALSLVTSDHAPYRFDETGKLSAGPNAPFHLIANGLPGLETRLPLMFDAMVSKGKGGALAFAALTATNPARIFGLQGKGAIAPGMDADLVIWDPERRVTYGENDLHDNVGYNPFVGHEVTGWPETVLLRGQVLVAGGAFLGTPGQGRWIARPEMGVRA